MGQRFSYEIWVPQERLYSFLERVNEIADEGIGTNLYWPDGRLLNLKAERTYYEGKQPKEVAFDSSIGNERLCAVLLFKQDPSFKRECIRGTRE